ncbi:MAG: MFS transporter [Phycisphaerales bacterium]|nr:MFS transporter [Phycisphaerales bacterium]
MAGLTHSKQHLHLNYAEGATRAWIAWSIPALFFLYEFMIRVMPAVIEGPLQQELGVSAGDIGLSMSFYYYAYGPMQLVVGVLLDRFGARIPLTIAAIVCAIGAIFFAMASSLFGLGAGRFLMGFGSAFAYVGTVYVATIWFPGRRIALISGLTVTLGMLGAIMAESTLQFLVDRTSWQSVMVGFAALGLVLAAMQFLLVPRRPDWFMEHVHASNTAGNTNYPGVLACIRQVITNRQTLLLSLITGLVYLPIGAFAALWGFQYLTTVLHVSKSDAGGVVSFIFVGLAVGGPCLGWLSDHLGRRAVFFRLLTGLGVLATCGLLLIGPGYGPILMISLLCLGLVVGVLVLAFPMAMEQNPCYARGTALTFVNLTQMLFAGLGQWSVGLLLDLEEGGVKNATHSPSDFRTALLLLPAGMLVAFILSFFLRDPRPPHAAD